MLAYAASRPTPVERRPHPNALLVIIAAHVAAVAALMSARMDLPDVIKDPNTVVFWVPKPADPPPPNPLPPDSRPQPTNVVTYTRPEPIEAIPLPRNPVAPSGGAILPNPIGDVAVTLPAFPPRAHDPVKVGATLLTSGDDLKPPYPSSKLITEEEASLTLRLTIDERGRVVAVEPVGKADRIFLEAARRHLLAHWRYRPASEDGRATASSAVVTLRFQLDG